MRSTFSFPAGMPLILPTSDDIRLPFGKWSNSGTVA
jgi:hypothetical protein